MNYPPLTRREFLQNSAVAAASAVALTNAAITATAADTAPAASAVSRMAGVELAVATICTDGFGNHQHEPAFRLLPQVGVPNVDFNVWYANLHTPAYVESLRARCAATGLRPICVQGSAFGGEGRNGVLKDVTHKLWLMEMARRLGCRRIKCTGARRDTQGGLAAVIETCRELAPAARELDVLVVLENHANNVLENIADYEEIFAAVDSPHVGMCLDTGHFEGVGITLSSVVEKFHTRTLHVDLKDCAAFGQGHNTVVYGEGITDFDAFLAQLLATGYTGYLEIEMAWNEPREPIVQNLVAARERFQRYARS